MKERVMKLLCVKSIVTILLTLVFCFLNIFGVVSQEFMTIYTVVIAFYFGTQAAKNENSKG